MTRVGEDEVSTFVGLGIARGLARRGAGLRNGLEIVRHRVAIDTVPVPCLEREQLPDLLLDELPRESDAGIETPVVPDLERELRFVDASAQFLAFLDGQTKRLLDEHMFAGVNRLERERHMELIRHPNKHGLDPSIRQHFVKIAISETWLMQRGH